MIIDKLNNSNVTELLNLYMIHNTAIQIFSSTVNTTMYLGRGSNFYWNNYWKSPSRILVCLPSCLK